MSDTSIAKHFSQYFQPVIADTAELKKEVYRIRYKVYCEELNYESTTKFPDGLETDVYDARSIHYLLKHRPTGVYAGCVRAVLPQAENTIGTFPSENVCPSHFSLIGRSRKNFCEVSRLAVPSGFRRRKGESNTPEGIVFSPSDTSEHRGQKRQFPLIALSLYWIAFSISLSLNLDGLTLMEPRLARHLRRSGIISELIGDLVNHRGKRGLFVIKPTELLYSIDDDMGELFEVIHSDVYKSVMSQIANKSKILLPQTTWKDKAMLSHSLCKTA